MSNYNPFFPPSTSVRCIHSNCNINQPFQIAQNMSSHAQQWFSKPQTSMAYVNNCCNHSRMCNSNSTHFHHNHDTHFLKNENHCNFHEPRHIEKFQPVDQICCNIKSEQEIGEVKCKTHSGCKYGKYTVPIVHSCIVDARKALNDSQTNIPNEFVQNQCDHNKNKICSLHSPQFQQTTHILANENQCNSVEQDMEKPIDQICCIKESDKEINEVKYQKHDECKHGKDSLAVHDCDTEIRKCNNRDNLNDSRINIQQNHCDHNKSRTCSLHSPQVQQNHSLGNKNQCENIKHVDHVCCSKKSEKEVIKMKHEMDNKCKYVNNTVPLIVHNCVVETRKTNNREAMDDSRDNIQYEFIGNDQNNNQSRNGL